MSLSSSLLPLVLLSLLALLSPALALVTIHFTSPGECLVIAEIAPSTNTYIAARPVCPGNSVPITWPLSGDGGGQNTMAIYANFNGQAPGCVMPISPGQVWYLTGRSLEWKAAEDHMWDTTASGLLLNTDTWAPIACGNSASFLPAGLTLPAPSTPANDPAWSRSFVLGSNPNPAPQPTVQPTAAPTTAAPAPTTQAPTTQAPATTAVSTTSKPVLIAPPSSSASATTTTSKVVTPTTTRPVVNPPVDTKIVETSSTTTTSAQTTTSAKSTTSSKVILPPTTASTQTQAGTTSQLAPDGGSPPDETEPVPGSGAAKTTRRPPTVGTSSSSSTSTRSISATRQPPITEISSPEPTEAPSPNDQPGQSNGNGDGNGNGNGNGATAIKDRTSTSWATFHTMYPPGGEILTGQPEPRPTAPTQIDPPVENPTNQPDYTSKNTSRSATSQTGTRETQPQPTKGGTVIVSPEEDIPEPVTTINNGRPQAGRPTSTRRPTTSTSTSTAKAEITVTSDEPTIIVVRPIPTTQVVNNPPQQEEPSEGPITTRRPVQTSTTTTRPPPQETTQQPDPEPEPQPEPTTTATPHTTLKPILVPIPDTSARPAPPSTNTRPPAPPPTTTQAPATTEPESSRPAPPAETTPSPKPTTSFTQFIPTFTLYPGFPTAPGFPAFSISAPFRPPPNWATPRVRARAVQTGSAVSVPVKLGDDEEEAAGFQDGEWDGIPVEEGGLPARRGQEGKRGRQRQWDMEDDNGGFQAGEWEGIPTKQGGQVRDVAVAHSETSNSAPPTTVTIATAAKAAAETLVHVPVSHRKHRAEHRRSRRSKDRL